MTEENKAYLINLAITIKHAGRFGNDTDEPEGIRYIRISDRLAKEISKNLLRIANEQ